jgi:surface carbohydrate biosynthesis protein
MGKFRVVIRAFTLRRDMSSAILVKRQLERMGCTVFLASSRNYYPVIKRWRPHAVILNVESVLPRTRKLLPDSIIALWHGEGGDPLETSEAMTLSRNPGMLEMIDGIFTFGAQNSRFFEDLFPGTKRKWMAAGSPRLELAKFNPDLIKLRRDSRSIGMPTRFSNINQCEGYPVFRTLDNPDSEWEIIHQAKSYATMVRVVERILADTDLTVSIRPHPTENPYSYRFLQRRSPERIEIDTSYDFSAWAARQKAIVGPSTNSILEAYVLRVPTVNIEALAGVGDTFETQGAAFDNLVLAQGSAYVPRDVDELIDMVRGELKAKPRDAGIDDLLRNVHNWYSEQSGTKIIAERTVELIRERGVRPGPHLPKSIIHGEDGLRFAKGWFRNRLITNFSFQYGYHNIPDYYTQLVANIEAGRRLDPALD